MATLNDLKHALRQAAAATAMAYPNANQQPLSEAEYSDDFLSSLMDRGGWLKYQSFIGPQLRQLLAPLFRSRHAGTVSVLEIGPGPESVLGQLPGELRGTIGRYVAFEPNEGFAARLEGWLCPGGGGGDGGSSTAAATCESPMPALYGPPMIVRRPFGADRRNNNNRCGDDGDDDREKFDVILFCHSLYGMDSQRACVERALKMLEPRGMVVVFHREGTLDLEGLVCYRTSSSAAAMAGVADHDAALDCFGPFIAGFTMQDVDADRAVRTEWRRVCRSLGRRETVEPGSGHQLLFRAPGEVLLVFTAQNANALPELEAAGVPLAVEGRAGKKPVKNRETHLQCPTAIVKPTEIRHVQRCVQWALEHGVGLTVLGGGHSGHCLRQNVVAVDMSAFDRVRICKAEEGVGVKSNMVVVAEAGCKTGAIVRKTMAAGLTVPLGDRPSVGAGLWLQGGIGHLARLYGLSCDAIIGAVIVSVDSGEVLCIGCVPSQHRPGGAVRPENEGDLLWAIKGGGTNFGIVISVTFAAYPAPTYLTSDWIVPLNNLDEALYKLAKVDHIASDLPRSCSADIYLYWDAGQLHLGVTMFEVSATGLFTSEPTTSQASLQAVLGPEESAGAVDGIGVFESGLYMSRMHGEHGGGKSSSFKRCIFLEHIGAADLANVLLSSVERRPSPLCYLHLLHGGGAIRDVAPEATAFGCRDWDFACVITGVWPRDQDGTAAAHAAVEWVYAVAGDLLHLPLSLGAYGADLGPDPRDAALAAEAFGPNRMRLGRLKSKVDPSNVLAYACPLPQPPPDPELIVLVTGECGAGKDYCANVWVSAMATQDVRALAVSISEAIKREYALATGADLVRLLDERAYKEQHRPALTRYFHDQTRQRSELPQEHFLQVVHGVAEKQSLDVLFITGMRDEAPVATLAHLVPESRLIEVCVVASEATTRIRRGLHPIDPSTGSDAEDQNPKQDWHPAFTFSNDTISTINTTNNRPSIAAFAHTYLLPFLKAHNPSLRQLGSMVLPTPDFPRRGIVFRHVLGIAQQPGGLGLCTSLLQQQLQATQLRSWEDVGAIVACEAGGYIFASALAANVQVPLVLVREEGKLPPPTVGMGKGVSHISAAAAEMGHDDTEKGPELEGGVMTTLKERKIEIERDVLRRALRGGKRQVVVVDDVLATGNTLLAVLRLLVEAAGMDPEQVTVLVVAEFPVHRGRNLLRRSGFGRVGIHCLLVFGGM